jgi:anti-sigma B factor antagonist
MLNIEKRFGEDTLIKVSGRIDTISAPDFEKAVDEVLEEANSLVFDLAGVEYISSAGLRVILKAQKVMGNKGKMKIINVPEAVREIFDITGFSDFLTIEDK